MKMGGDYRYYTDTQFPASPSLQFGTSNFDGFATGQPFADFLLGIPRTVSRSSSIGPFYGSNSGWSLFVQDNWRLNRSFNLHIGIRYERHNPFKEQNDRVYSFDPLTGSIVVPNETVRAHIHPLFPKNIPVLTASQARFPERSLIAMDKNDFAPRVGFAWRTGFSDVVFRGGYGVFYNFEANKGFRTMTTGPFLASETFDNRITAGQPLWAWPLAIPNAAARPLGTQDLFITARGMHSSYVHQWNLTLEKQFGPYGVRVS
jgi:hypothetical protein